MPAIFVFLSIASVVTADSQHRRYSTYLDHMERQCVEKFVCDEHGILFRAGLNFSEQVVPVNLDVSTCQFGLLQLSHGKTCFNKVDIDMLVWLELFDDAKHVCHQCPPSWAKLDDSNRRSVGQLEPFRKEPNGDELGINWLGGSLRNFGTDTENLTSPKAWLISGLVIKSPFVPNTSFLEFM